MDHSGVCANGGRNVVGFDDTAHSRAALEWAAREARIRRVCLHVVHSRTDRGQDRTEQEVQRILRATDAAGPDFVIESAGTDPVETLVVASHGAALLVAGTHEPEPFLGVVETSVSRRAAARATCPVAIVRQETAGLTESYGRIVVGIDETLSALDALRFAAAEAWARGCEVRTVHVLTRPGPEPWVDRLSYL